jgi:methionyl-tRNA formyltransferase
MGTPEFAVHSLEATVAAGHQVVLVLTQPDRPKGRGGQIAESPVKTAAAGLKLDVYQPERVRRPEVVQRLADLAADAMVVVGYGQIIPQNIIDLPRLGIVNVHASILPKYRGAAPIQWAIANGEIRTGVTTMRIDAGLDTGDILLTREIAIGPDETAPELSARLAALGAALLVETLAALQTGTIEPEPQDHSNATLAPILKKEHGLIDWSMSAEAIHNRARGFLPWPGAYTRFRGQLLHLWRTRVPGEVLTGAAGTVHVVKRRMLIACSGGAALEAVEVQLEGRRRLTAEQFVNGVRIADNERLGGES